METEAPLPALPSEDCRVGTDLSRYVRVHFVSSPKREDRLASADPEGDADAAAHVRWPDADAMRHVLGERAQDLREPPWTEVVAKASEFEAALLTPRASIGAGDALKAHVRPFTHAEKVSALGVSARYAVVASYSDDNETPTLWACPVSRSDKLDWRALKGVLPRGVRIRQGYVCGARLLLWVQRGKSERIGIVGLPRGHRLSLALDVSGLGIERVVFNECYVVALSGSTMHVWTYGVNAGWMGEKTLPQLSALPSCTTPLGVDAKWSHTHSEALVSARLCGAQSDHEAAARRSQDRLVCGDAKGQVLAFVLSQQRHAGTTSFAGLAAAPVRVVAFGGSRIVASTDTQLACVDREPARASHQVLGRDENGQGDDVSSVVDAGTWGDALVTHDASNMLLVRHARTGRVVNAFPHRDLVAQLPKPTAPYQSLAVAGDQIAVLYQNGMLLMVDI